AHGVGRADGGVHLLGRGLHRNLFALHSTALCRRPRGRDGATCDGPPRGRPVDGPRPVRP
ncbi:hypothetical protein ACWCXL_42925, partial [Streptomyces sp. NPDC001588]